MIINSKTLPSLTKTSLVFVTTLLADRVFAQACDDKSVQGGIECAKGNLTDITIQTGIRSGINTAIVVAGIIAVIYIIVGGLKYIFSQGDETAIKSAKNTILYAIIGLIVCLLAFAIVNFILIRI